MFIDNQLKYYFEIQNTLCFHTVDNQKSNYKRISVRNGHRKSSGTILRCIRDSLLPKLYQTEYALVYR